MRSTLFIMAWRNIWRNRRRSAITIAAIAISLVALIFLWGFSDGVHNAAVRNFESTFVGSLQIHADGYFKNPKLETALAEPAAIAQILTEQGVDRWAQRVRAFALLAAAQNSEGALLVGVDPVREPRVTRVAQKLQQGRFLRDGDSFHCLIGALSARGLQLKLHDNIALLVPARDGTLAAERFEIVGIIETGAPELDRGIVLIPLATAQELTALGSAVTEFVVSLPAAQLDATVATLRQALAAHNTEVLPWYEMFPSFREWIALDNSFYYIFLGIFLIIIVAGISNTVLMSMLERVRELGVLLALGSSRTAVAMLMAMESLLLGIVGTAVGTMAGLALVNLLHRTGIDLSLTNDAMRRYYIDPLVRPEINTDHLALTVGAVLLVSLLAAIYPAWKAARLEPVAAIHHV